MHAQRGKGGRVVYKVQSYKSSYDYNAVERDAIRYAHSIGAKWAPPATLYRFRDEVGDRVTVLAMPFIPELCDYEQADSIRGEATNAGVSDLATFNMRVTTDGRVMVIDFGCWEKPESKKGKR